MTDTAIATEAKFVQIPAGMISSMRRALASDREPLEAVNLLRQVGYEAGEAVHAALAGHLSGGGDAGELDAGRFWQGVSDYFERIGWGRVEHRRLHPGVGALDLVNWLEAGSDGGPAGCHLSTGFFTDLLGRVAGAGVVVMEVPAEPGRSRLLFGSGDTLGAVYQSLASGASLDEALGRLQS
ncbi:hypothetical protein [Longimicrobium sp.]|uniref:hypothetical protein n=1 Tax=Longimicrobium sp. TaxID=2029185 RepID=UPI002D040518|nr:hypothetical protein [Longimicrobium sp.]HSU12986.1 hypothetical protein [Longimicrobium sp.]